MRKTITKYRLFNKYNLLAIVLMLTILWLSWAFVSNFVGICTMDYSAPDLAISSDAQREEVKYEFIVSILTWERYIDSSMTYIVYIFPLFSLITVLPFCDELTGYYSYPARFRSIKRALIKGVFQHALLGGGIISIIFFVFFTVGAIFMVPQIDDIGGYASILPAGFYKAHPYLFFLFMSITIYFAIGFAFALLGCGIALITKKKQDVIIIPMLLYISDAYVIGGVLGLYKYQIFSSVCAFNTVYSTGEIFIPLLPFLAVSIVLLWIALRGRDIL